MISCSHQMGKTNKKKIANAENMFGGGSTKNKENAKAENMFGG